MLAERLPQRKREEQGRQDTMVAVVQLLLSRNLRLLESRPLLLLVREERALAVQEMSMLYSINKVKNRRNNVFF